MLFKRNIWTIFYYFLAIALAYLIFFNISYWQSLQQRVNAEISSINNVFASSIESIFNQHEVVLDLLGQQLFNDDFYKNKIEGTAFLDKHLKQNNSLVSLSLATVDGKIILSSTNVGFKEMLNLRESQKTQESFLESLEVKRLSIGRTYFVKSLNSYALPIRKAIRDKNGLVLGVMILEIKPEQLLFGLRELTHNSKSSEYTSLLLQDKTLFRLYFASNITGLEYKAKIGGEVPLSIYNKHFRAIEEQLGLTEDGLRVSNLSAEYHSKNSKGAISQYSIVYLSKFKLWSLVVKPRRLMRQDLLATLITSLVIFGIVISIFFMLFRSLGLSIINSRKKLVQQVNHDFLTGLNNRLFLKYIEPNWVDNKQNRFSVLFIDLDNFKSINDSYGHNIGDLILKDVAQRLITLFDENDVVCRQGGDEFIILYQETNNDLIIQKSKDMFEQLTKPYAVDQYEFVIGASMGVSQFPKNGVDFDTLFSAADTAMYSAKGKKLNYEFYTQSLSVKTAHEANIEQALHSAQQKNEMFMVYQPQIDLHGNVYGFEALVRWENETLGFVPPDQFISIAENSGIILEIGDFVLHQSISDIANLSQRVGRNDLQLSVNISVRQFLQENFLDSLKVILTKFDYPATQLTLEITESIFIDDLEHILPLFNSIRALGIHLSLDDFGTGFSSLSMLKQLPIDELKIDKSFIDPIVDNEADRTMVVNILNIAKSLNLKVVAEGIEDKEQADILTQHRCDVQQGYFHSKPIRIASIIELCHKSKRAKLKAIV